MEEKEGVRLVIYGGNKDYYLDKEGVKYLRVGDQVSFKGIEYGVCTEGYNDNYKSNPKRDEEIDRANSNALEQLSLSREYVKPSDKRIDLAKFLLEN